MKKTRAIEILSEAGVPFKVLDFHAVEYTAEEAVAKLHLPAEQVFKTLVTASDDRTPLYVMALVPARGELNLKRLAEYLGVKRMQMVDLKDLTRLTGYLKGGCAPLGSKRAMRVVVDASAHVHDAITFSAGQRGLQVTMSPADFLRVADATTASIAD